MALTQPQRIQISGEMVDLPLRVQSALDTQTQIDAVKTDLQNRDNSLKIFFDKYNDIANAYQTEHRWINGTTYTTVVNSDLEDAAQKKPGNKHFATDGSWLNFQPKKHSSSEGLPTSLSGGHELEIFTKNIEDGGLTALLDFLINGQTSGVANDTLGAAYIPGSGNMTVTSGGQTVGNLIIVEGGGFSGLFLVDSVTGPVLTVTEVFPPDGVLPMTTSTVKENIIAFTNSERNTLTSTDYENVLDQLANAIIASVLSWETILNNQLAQLNANNDSRNPQVSEIAAAIADITNAKNIIDYWQALPDTGVTLLDSKFVNANIIPIQNEVTDRTAYSTTRMSEITTALGNISQSGDGTFSGVGIYYERFNQINLRINLVGGPLTEYYEKNLATSALNQIADTATSTSAAYNTELRTEPLSASANGSNTIVVASITGFAVGNSIYVMADTLTELSGTITAINGLNVTLSFSVPNTYTTALKARLYKQL